MSVSSVAPTPFYQDPDRLQIAMPQPRVADKASGSDAKHLDMFAEDDGPSFWDVLDVINPLQHIPIVNDMYRDLTGDQIGVGARLAGGTLFGGVIGLAAAAINVAVEESTGKNVGGHVLALFKDDDAPAAPDAPGATQLASAAIPEQSAAAQPIAAASASVPAQPSPSADAAPVIALPDSVPAAKGQPMMFTFDGAQPVSAAVPAAAPPAVTAAPAVAQVTSKPLGAPARYLPTPARNANFNPAPMPPVTVPVANGSSRSNVPITGRAPNAAAATATNAAMQRALAGQDASHPMAPPTDAGGQTAANPDWFSAAWGQALDKYQRANQLNGKPPTTATLE